MLITHTVLAKPDISSDPQAGLWRLPLPSSRAPLPMWRTPRIRRAGKRRLHPSCSAPRPHCPLVCGAPRSHADTLDLTSLYSGVSASQAFVSTNMEHRRIGVAQACEVLGVPRSSLYRARRSPQRALSGGEKVTVRETLNGERFWDCTPREVYATSLDDGIYLCPMAPAMRGWDGGRV